MKSESPPPIPRRSVQLDGLNLELSAICLGGNVFGWTLDRRHSFAVLDSYVAHGGNFIDTADSYSAWAPGNSGGESETIIGEWLASRRLRENMTIATKVGYPGSPTTPEGGLTADGIKRSVDASLLRLQTDYVDVLYAHRDDPSTELAETLGGFAELIAEGKARHIAASNYSRARLDEAFALCDETGLPSFSALQPRFNLVDRAEMAELAAVIDRNELAVFTHSTLGGGFLSGKYRPGQRISSKRAADVARYLTRARFEALGTLEDLAASRGEAPAALAVAWALAQPRVTCVLASATSAGAMGDLVRACSIQLSQDEARTLGTSWRAETPR